jgi:hypothetical protein
VCLRKDYPLAYREVLLGEALLSKTPNKNQSVRPINIGERPTCMIKDRYLQDELPQYVQTPLFSCRINEEVKYKIDPYLEYECDLEDFDIELSRPYKEAQRSY